jgi:hypothetical protein
MNNLNLINVGLQIGSFYNTFYVYYETGTLAQKNRVIVESGFKTKEDANKWIDNIPDIEG